MSEAPQTMSGQSDVRSWVRHQGERVNGRAVKLRERMILRCFPALERMGIHAVPRHWFEPIPDRSTLTEDVFRHESAMVGVDLRPEAQLNLLQDFARCYGDEFRHFPATADQAEPGRYFLYNGSFECVDAEIAYSMIRWLSPRTVVEVGVGYSSILIDQALQRNEEETGIRCHHVGIDPWPGDDVNGIADLELLRHPVEQTPLDLFTNLQADDVLFIDSTHVLRTGGDIAFEFLEVLPRLAPGVVVHFHDIFLPREYPRTWLVDHLWFPTEQYVLQAFLTYNDAYEVLWSGAAMAASHPVELAQAIPSQVTKIGPGSFWIRRKGHDAPPLSRGDLLQDVEEVE